MIDLEFIINIIGWIGAMSLFVAYLVISSGRTHSKSFFYQGLNIVGSIGFIVNSYYFGAMPSVALNALWLTVGLTTLLKPIMKQEN